MISEFVSSRFDSFIDGMQGNYLGNVKTSNINQFICKINLFLTNVPPLYPLKTSENQRFSFDFRGYRSGILVENGLKR